MRIRLAHSPDADDAFMFSALFQKKVSWEGLEFEEARQDIESLNKIAQNHEESTFDVSAVSFFAYPQMSERYIILSTGGCFGDGYGPIVVTKKNLKSKQLLKVRMAVPGKNTTAFLALRLYEQFLTGESKSGICYSEVSFDEVMNQVNEGKVDAGLVIHEGQLSYVDEGLIKFVDLGEWWKKENKMVLPLGCIVVRRDLPRDVQLKIGRVIQSSIKYAMTHKDEILPLAIPMARGLDPERAEKFIDMYVNDLTVECGRAGYKAIKTLYDKGERLGFVKTSFNLDESFLDMRRGQLKSEYLSLDTDGAEVAASVSEEVGA